MFRRIFRSSHWLLLLATLLTLALLFAPVTYASNFSTNVYAELHGTWGTVENTLLSGPGRWVTYTCFEDPLHLLYAAVTLASLLFLTYAVVLGGHDERRARLCGFGVLFVLGQIGASLLLWLHVTSYVGAALPENLESGLNREWAFHLFILLFLLRSRYHYRRALGVRLTRAAAGSADGDLGA